MYLQNYHLLNIFSLLYIPIITETYDLFISNDNSKLFENTILFISYSNKDVPDLYFLPKCTEFILLNGAIIILLSSCDKDSLLSGN